MKTLFSATIAATIALSALTFGAVARAQDAAAAKAGDAAAGQKKNAMCIWSTVRGEPDLAPIVATSLKLAA